MPRDGAIIFDDLVGKLDVLRIECAKCERSGRYRLADLISRYGRDAKLFAFTDDVTATCERRRARCDSDPCGAPARYRPTSTPGPGILGRAMLPGTSEAPARILVWRSRQVSGLLKPDFRFWQILL
jgi:hypothetical protein